ncbi:MAG: aminotransferase class V-fold PLP-dependent enzyme, partial [Deltaproteobacteria bacterium]|nr:aminotransferase class V-fold PLP-dependent enzyme [Deltaproteobacteria bacterium]
MKAVHEVTAQEPWKQTRAALDLPRIRADFPILRRKVHGKALVYLDNAATTQKPQVVIDALRDYYTAENSNVHRGIHFLSEQATNAYEGARAKVKTFLNAAGTRGIIFVRGTTEGINLVANSYGRAFIAKGDEIIISAMEHHSNIVPWQFLRKKGVELRFVDITEDGLLDMEHYSRLVNRNTKLV